jgi:hypothetical protein
MVDFLEAVDGPKPVNPFTVLPDSDLRNLEVKVIHEEPPLRPGKPHSVAP